MRAEALSGLPNSTLRSIRTTPSTCGGVASGRMAAPPVVSSAAGAAGLAALAVLPTSAGDLRVRGQPATSDSARVITANRAALRLSIFTPSGASCFDEVLRAVKISLDCRRRQAAKCPDHAP